MLQEYLDQLAATARTVLGRELVGAYVGGSYALCAYEQGRSDLDVAMVVAKPLTTLEKQRVVDLARHEALPCPARGLELVVYCRDAAASPAIDADFELNLNSGCEMSFRADFEPDLEETHWFAIDRAILRNNAAVLAGPPPTDVFGEIPRPLLLGVLAEAVRWHTHGEAKADDVVLNACRALHYARTGTWASKPHAGGWALEHVFAADLVAAALAARAGGATIDSAPAQEFARRALAELELELEATVVRGSGGLVRS